MKNLFICYSKWGTCKKARKWLEKNNIEFTEREITVDNPTEDELKEWINRSEYPIKKFYNTSGNIYKELNLKDKLTQMSQQEQIKLLSTDGMLVKRPLVITHNGKVLVGFKEEEWEILK